MNVKLSRFILSPALILLVISGIFKLNTSTVNAEPVSSAVNNLPGGKAAQTSGSIAVNDPNIQYMGRWDTYSAPTVVRGHWPGVYFRVQFSGTTTIGLQITSAVTFYASIDGGGDVLYNNASGVVMLATGLSTGSHTLRVATRTENDVMRLEQILVDSGGFTQAPAPTRPVIEFVGDSITAGRTSSEWALTSYAWLTGENLNAEHTNISFTGICLVDGVTCGWNEGMSVAFFKLQSVMYGTGASDWDFSRYQARAVIINLGTNDDAYGVSDSVFQSTYITFLQNIRAKYHNADIFVMSTFNGLKVLPTQAAVSAVNAAGDMRVHFVDTTGWLSPGDFADTYHLTDGGHVKVAAQLTTILQPYLYPPTPTPTLTPTITNTPDPGQLKVQYKVSNTNPTDAGISPYLRIVNTTPATIPLYHFKLRYWFTRDTPRTVQFSCTYALANCATVNGSFVLLPTPVSGADSYVEIGFTASAPDLAAHGTSGDILTYYNKDDYSAFNEANDYSYDPTKTTYADWSNVTLYRDGVLIWGSEPTGAVTATPSPTSTPSPTLTPVPSATPGPSATPSPTSTPGPSATPSVAKLKLQYRTPATNKIFSQLNPFFRIVNTGSTSVPLAQIRIRYWFTRDTSTQAVSYKCDWAMMGCSNIFGSVTNLATSLPGADTYLEIGFYGGTLAPNSNTGEIETTEHKADWSNFNQDNDYSFNPKTTFFDWTRVTMYRNGALIWGTEPAGAGAAAPAPTFVPSH